MQIIRDVEQGSEKWFKLRELRMTASHAQSIAAAGKGLDTYIRTRIQNYKLGQGSPIFINDAIENGIKLEPEARSMYEITKGIETRQVGFVIYNDYVGCSPDMLICKKGLGEIKCPTDRVFLRYLKDKIINTKYLWQMQMQMMICERSWCDYIVYNPHFLENIIVKRVYADTAMFQKLKAGLVIGTELIKELLEGGEK